MRQLWSPAWILRHLGAVVLVAGFLGLGWWQISRAAAGNTLSWAYAVEWPVFAGFVVFVWVREMRLATRQAAPAGSAESAGSAGSAGSTEATGVGVAEAANDAEPAIGRPIRTRSMLTTPVTGTDDPELAAYNRYLAWLNANPQARASEYPG
ncbi:hypothetical protein ACN27F_09460 [Solwaraspora sp. WMMB335]|uniref:hypothetical protein n=1 Tax=Solwaraspora sp. WMMB335 TaxID=3404118 RepID=UPI003B955D63